MSTTRRHGAGWVAIGDAAGLVNPMNGEGIDYGLESGMLAADLFLRESGDGARALRRGRSVNGSTASCAPGADSPS